MSSCSHCGKQRAALKRCSRCKQTSYCGARCQNAAWKGHKKSCVSLDDVFEKVNAAKLSEDWREVLKWEGRMDEMVEGNTDAACNNIFAMFANAHRRGSMQTGLVLQCWVPERSVEGAQEVVLVAGRCVREGERSTSP